MSDNKDIDPKLAEQIRAVIESPEGQAIMARHYMRVTEAYLQESDRMSQLYALFRKPMETPDHESSP